MNVLLITNLYSNSRGGGAIALALLYRGLKQCKCNVAVLTRCPDRDWDDEHIFHHPNGFIILREIFKADCIVVSGTALRLSWPLLIFKKKYFIWRQIFIAKRSIFASMVAKWFESRARIISISHYMAELEDATPRIIGNPYDDEIFYSGEAVAGRGKAIFVGRLVPEKGVEVLIDAIEIVSNKGHAIDVTVAGDGEKEYEAHLKNIVLAKGLDSVINFVGPMRREEVAVSLREHDIMIVPSVWEEPFGIVALEGIASGCHVIASNVGGLPDAVAGCGVLYRATSPIELAEEIIKRIEKTEIDSGNKSLAQEHLLKRTPISVARSFLKQYDEM
jgi:glycogen synthase